jgi:Holliday junction resolvasome RuvABC endonuclease subunit
VSAPAYPIILALDPGTKRIGYGAVHADNGAPVTCGSVDIAPGSFDLAVRLALVEAGRHLPREAEVADVVVEWMGGGRAGVQSLITLADAAGQIAQAASQHWSLPVGRRRPQTWKKAVGLPGNCRAEAAIERAFELGFEVPALGRITRYYDNDAASAACMAKAAWIEADREAA